MLATPLLEIRLLGGFNLMCAGEPVTGIAAPRAQALLAYVLLHRDAPQSRQHLAFRFWPDVSEAQARNNLRQALHTLRQALPNAERFLFADTHSLRWHPDAPFHLDVADVEQALAQAEVAAHEGNVQAEREALTRAVAAYAGDLLPSCYDEWIAPLREGLRLRYQHALARLVILHEAAGDVALAVADARRWVASDPLSEEACRALMRALLASGDRAGALQAYTICVAALERELGMTPSPETTDLLARIRGDSSGAARARTDTQPAQDHQKRDQGPPAQPKLAPHHDATGDTARDGAAPTVITLIGRRSEFGQLRAAWERAATGAPGFALVTGEAGIGKSRLAEEVALAASRAGASVAQTRCYAAEGRLSLAPAIDWLRDASIRPHVTSLDPVWLAEVSRILPDVRRDAPDLPPYEPISEYGQRQRFFEALARAVLAAPQPTLLIIDDLQWCDQETLEWLHYLLRFDPAARLLVLGTARTEELAPGHPLRTLLLDLHHTSAVLELPLHRLDAAETARLAGVVAARTLDDRAALRLFAETEGNPLFVVETMRAGFTEAHAHPSTPPSHHAESDDGQAHSEHTDDLPLLPPRVRAVLAARLAQLSPPARELATVAAAIGREVRLDVLASASATSEEDVVRLLDELWQRRIMRDQGASSYDFTHDKLREVTYAEASIPQRRLLHRHIALALESVFAADLDAVSGQIASHYDQAGMAARAIPFYTRAAEVAQRVYANEDAIRDLVRALALLEDLPSGRGRDARELALLLKLVPTYRIVRGWTAPELERAVGRALHLCETVGDEAQHTEALYDWETLLVVQARFEQVLQVDAELQTRKEYAPEAVLSLSRMMVAGTHLHRGALAEASAMFDDLIASADATSRSIHRRWVDWNFAVHSRAWQAHVLWCLGYPDRALRLGREAVRYAHDLALPFNQALAATYLTPVLQWSADNATLRTCADEAYALTVEYKAPYYRAWAFVLATYAHTWEQPTAASRARLRAAIDAFLATGARIRLPYYCWLLASCDLRMGHGAQALAALEEGFTFSAEQHERWWDAELYRLRAEVRQTTGVDATVVEADLQRALDVAGEQQARSLELRAAMSLARWLRGRGRAAEGRARLSAVYDWFTEGFETPDLRAARTLLDEMA